MNDQKMAEIVAKIWTECNSLLREMGADEYQIEALNLIEEKQTDKEIGVLARRDKCWDEVRNVWRYC